MKNENLYFGDEQLDIEIRFMALRDVVEYQKLFDMILNQVSLLTAEDRLKYTAQLDVWEKYHFEQIMIEDKEWLNKLEKDY